MSIDPLDYFIQGYENRKENKSITGSQNNAEKQAEKQKDEGFSFADFLDIINPLQHIPLISNIYREITGDEISDKAKFAGDAVYTGLLGGIGFIGLFADFVTQKDAGEHLASFSQLAFDEQKEKDFMPEIKASPVQAVKIEALAPLVMANEVVIEDSVWLKS